MRRLTLSDAEIMTTLVKTCMGSLAYGFEVKEWLQNESHVALLDGDDLGLFETPDGYTFKMHWCFSSKGKTALRVASSMRDKMFDDFGALMLWGWTPVFCSGARWFNRQLGGVSRGVHETENGPEEFFYLERTKWVTCFNQNNPLQIPTADL